MSRSLVARSHHEDPLHGKVDVSFSVDREEGTAMVETTYGQGDYVGEVAYTRDQLLERIRILRDLVVRLEGK